MIFFAAQYRFCPYMVVFRNFMESTVGDVGTVKEQVVVTSSTKFKYIYIKNNKKKQNKE